LQKTTFCIKTNIAMKKTVLIIMLCIAFGNIKAQSGFETQISIGLPSNILSKETSSFDASFSLGYMFSNNDQDLKKEFKSNGFEAFETAKSWQFGVTAGYSYTIREENFKNLQLIPIAAVVRVYFLGVFSVGGGIGYAFALEPNDQESGVYGEATLGIGLPRGSIFFSTRGVNSSNGPEFEWSTMSIGLRFLLGKKK
jgi:hypothetical protein